MFGYNARDRPDTCRHCGWKGRLKRSTYRSPPTEELCPDCGRVAIKKNPAQRAVYKPLLYDILLGTTNIPFRLKVRDPRSSSEYKANWEQNKGKPGWNYNVKDMEEELFKDRLGERPKPRSIAKMLPVVDFDKVPPGIEFQNVGPFEHEGVVIESSNHRLLLLALTNYDTRYNLKAKWDRQTSSGVRMIIHASLFFVRLAFLISSLVIALDL